MNKIEEIVKAWAISINPNEFEKSLAEKRYSVCSKCEDRKFLLVEYCGVCKCPLSKKIFSPLPQDACPKGKWFDVDEEVRTKNLKKYKTI